jgi:hypothetical protein
MNGITARWADGDRFVRYLLAWRSQLQRLYKRPYNTTAQRLLKAEMLAELASCYATHRDQLGRGASDWFFREPINNARPCRLRPIRTRGRLSCLQTAGKSGRRFARGRDEAYRSDARVAELNRLANLRPPPTPDERASGVRRWVHDAVTRWTAAGAAVFVSCGSPDYGNADAFGLFFGAAKRSHGYRNTR